MERYISRAAPNFSDAGATGRLVAPPGRRIPVRSEVRLVSTVLLFIHFWKSSC